MRTHLCFHGIGRCTAEREEGEARYWVETNVFLRILDEVRDRPDVELSFDDGNRSDVDVALPALLERGLSATFFVLAGRLHDPASLGGSDLGRLVGAGMGIGSHGWDHVPWRGLAPAQARREFVEARSVLEQASGQSVRRAALPLGRYDRSALQGLKEAGYATVFTSDRFPARPTSWLQARYSVLSEDTVESVAGLLGSRPGLREARNVLASCVKRIR